MKKKIILEHFGTAIHLANTLGYTHRNVYYSWPDELSPMIMQSIIGRMMIRNLPVPAAWRK